jgi:hypothetical protein
MTNKKYQIRVNVEASSPQAARAKLMDLLRNGVPDDFNWETRLQVILIEEVAKRPFEGYLPRFPYSRQ